MAEIKTGKTDLDVDNFISEIGNENRKNDIIRIKTIFDKITNEKAIIWNNEMIGYGIYHYKSTRSSQEGDWPLTAFSSRKQNITIYIMNGINKYVEILDRLGKHKRSKGSCLYINKLADIDTDVLSELIKISYSDFKKIQSEN